MENNLNFLVVFKNQPPKKRSDGYFLASAGSRVPAGTRRVEVASWVSGTRRVLAGGGRGSVD